MNENKYIRTRARTLPLGSCYLNRNWQQMGMAQIMVTRLHNNCHLTVGVFLVDTYAMGVKDSFYRFNMSEHDFTELLTSFRTKNLESGDRIEEADYTLCHNIIYGAMAFAEEHGFIPCKEFAVTKYIIQEDTEDIELIELEFGRDGKPFVITGPYD